MRRFLPFLYTFSFIFLRSAQLRAHLLWWAPSVLWAGALLGRPQEVLENTRSSQSRFPGWSCSDEVSLGAAGARTGGIQPSEEHALSPRSAFCHFISSLGCPWLFTLCTSTDQAFFKHTMMPPNHPLWTEVSSLAAFFNPVLPTPTKRILPIL